MAGVPREFSNPSLSTNPVLQEKINKLYRELEGEWGQYQDRASNLVLDNMNITSLDGIAFRDEIVDLHINRNPIASLENVRFPRNLKNLRITDSQITSLRGINWPDNLIELNIDNSRIATLEGVIFPPTLNALRLNGCNITTLEGVIFPVNLAYLMLTRTGITSLKGAIFPNKLINLFLNDNQIASFEGMKIPLLLSSESFHIKDNPIVPDTISLLERPTEAVKRAIVRDYPQTAAYFESQRESEEINMRNLQNHVRSIAAFLQPLIAERKAKEEANLTRGKPVLFVVNSFNGTRYSIPFVASQTVQTAIDYLEQNYLLSVTNSYAKIRLTKSSDNTVLDPSRTFADMNINNEDIVNVISDNSTAQAVQISRGGRIQNKTKRKRSRSRRYN